MKRYSYPLLIIKNTHGVVAYLEGLDNVELYGEGRTIREAKAALRRAFEFYLESCRKEHVPVPASNVTSCGAGIGRRDLPCLGYEAVLSNLQLARLGANALVNKFVAMPSRSCNRVAADVVRVHNV